MARRKGSKNKSVRELLAESKHLKTKARLKAQLARLRRKK
jgi:hypothetical protein